MERKTKKVDGVWTAPCKYGKFLYPIISQETIDRLAAYEDTGLEPEEVAAFDRLVALYVEAGLDKNFVLACIEATKAGMTIDRLRELAEADREGRCVVLPRLEPGRGDPAGELGEPGPPGVPWSPGRHKTYNELIKWLRTASGSPGGVKMSNAAADALAGLQAELEQVKRERDAAVEAVKNMAEYIVCAGRVDYYLCDEISQEHHLKYQPKNDGNYDNEPCYKCIADWFLQGHEWQENCW